MSEVSDADRVERLRELFPVTRRWAYLNHAGIGPMPRLAAGAVGAVVAGAVEDGDRRWPERNAGVEEARGLVARLLGARDLGSVAFTENTSAALSLVAEGLDWQAGDNVVGAACEFPSNVYPSMNLGRRGVELRLAPEVDGRVPLEEIAARVDGRTRAVALSWVEYASGFRVDLGRIGELCRERGALFVVDAIQGLGALRLDVEAVPVDAVAAAAHKWLLGPEGVAVLWLGPRALDRLVPVRAGWRSMRHMFDWDGLELDFPDAARAWECGTLNSMGIHALGESVRLLLELGPEAVERRVLALADRVADGAGLAGWTVASPRGATERSGIVSLSREGVEAREVAERLAAQGIVVADRAGRLRVSPHVYNTEEEVDRALAALAES